ncbi:MAG: sigma-54-dependent Fis family transcriptional regulator [Myxococcales bacterium]|nr:sigma-54-dependent Fis family transcriptional regulator [Myxococcales bacterium]
MTSLASILVVDDDDALARFVAEILVDQGYSVSTAPSAERARESIEAEDFDVVVTDLRMPGGSGLELIGWIKNYDPRLAVLAITAYGSIETAVQAVRMGASDYIPKPFEPDVLLLAVSKALREHSLRAELSALRTEVQARRGFGAIVAKSSVMREVLSLAERVADSPSTVLITGPSGAGKEVLARAVHQHSRRRARPFIAINCAAIPDTLLESELFGHKKGAFTGATSDRPGLFKQAHGGTLFLDEIGDLPQALQAKLLRVLQDREVRPVGSERSDPVDVRVLAATHRDLRDSITKREFREDLFYRLAVIELHVPPLADRVEDVVLLAEHFLHEHAARIGRPVHGFSGAALKLLEAYSWPGNVRELQNVVERAINLAQGELIAVDDLPLNLRKPREEGVLDRAIEREMTIAELEITYARRMLARNGNNKKKTARMLGIDRRTLQRWLGEREDEREPEETSE